MASRQGISKLPMQNCRLSAIQRSSDTASVTTRRQPRFAYVALPAGADGPASMAASSPQEWL